LEALQATLRRMLVRAGLAINAWVVALIFVQAAAGFLMLALFLSLGPAVPTVQAAVATAAGALGLALLSGLMAIVIASGSNRFRSQPALPPNAAVRSPGKPAAAVGRASETIEERAPSVAVDQALIEGSLAEIARLTRTHPMAALLAGGLVGVCLGADPKLREQLFKLFKLP